MECRICGDEIDINTGDTINKLCKEHLLLEGIGEMNIQTVNEKINQIGKMLADIQLDIFKIKQGIQEIKRCQESNKV